MADSGGKFKIMKRVIITGATGAIGIALIKELINKKVEVLVFTRKESKRNCNIPKSNYIQIKYCSLSNLKNISNESNIEYDVFFHLAWAGTSGEDRNDKKLQEKNVEYALDAVECAKRFKCKKFVGIGSQAEYGRADCPLTENTPTKPENEYGKAKLKASILTKQKSLENGLEFNWIRVLSVFGPNDGGNTLISYAIKQFMKNEELDVTKCEQIWDYLYSEDAAKAIILVAKKGIKNKTYVLGSGSSRPLKEYLEDIKRVMKSNSVINYGKIPYIKNQTMSLYADISDLLLLGWTPKISFKKGILKIKNK